jgi:two-component system, LytTR family, sensor kinase
MILDKEIRRFIIVFYLFSCLFSIAISLFQKIFTGDLDYLYFEELLYVNLFNYGTKFIFIFFALIVTRKFLIDKASLVISVVIHTFISIVLSLYCSLILLTFEKFVYHRNIILNWESILERFVYGSNFNFFIYFTLITFLYAFYYFKKQKSLEFQNVLITNQLLDSKIKSLQTQIQPHFLFNALNGISSLMRIDLSKSQNAIVDLSDLLRETLKLNDLKLHSLKNELNLLQKYINIEKTRFAEKINFKIHLHDNLLNYKLPPLILQPIVENSIKHGFSYNHDTLEIILDFKEFNNWFVINIENNGNSLKPNYLKEGTGLKNVIERLVSIYDTHYFFEFENKLEGGVKTIIKIPIK